MERDHILEAAERDLARLDAQRQSIADFIERYKRYKGVANSAPAPLAKADSVSSGRKSVPLDTLMSAVHDILEKRQDALTLGALYDALLERGVEVGGQHPKQNLSQKLSAHPDLKSYGKRGWYFADQVPRCAQSTRLSDEPDYDEESPVTEMTGPLQTNGAAVPAA